MKTVQRLIDENAARQPGNTFLVVPETGAEMRFARLREHVLDINARLDAMGVARGEKVAFLLPNSYWSAVLFIGVMYSGRVIVPLNAVSGEISLSYVLEHRTAG